MTAATEASTSAVRRDTGRLEAFSDGVFAIAITILVLEIKVPLLEHDATPGELAQALWAAWPTYAAFITSFASVLIIWINHHGIFQKVDHVDPVLMLANGRCCSPRSTRSRPTSWATTCSIRPARWLSPRMPSSRSV